MIKEFLQGRALNHPLHPMLVHLPIGLWIGSLIFDIAYLVGQNPAFASASYYCILVGVISVLLAAPTGIAEFLDISRQSRAKRIATVHMILNVSVTVFYLVNVIMRNSLGNDAVTWGQFFFSLASIVILGVSGYLGGLLVYDHGIGFKPQSRSRFEKRPEPEQKPRRIA